MAEFNVWLLMVGLGIGVGVTLFLVARFTDLEERVDVEHEDEMAHWIARLLYARGHPVDAATVTEILRLRALYDDQSAAGYGAPGAPAGPLPTEGTARGPRS